MWWVVAGVVLGAAAHWAWVKYSAWLKARF